MTETEKRTSHDEGREPVFKLRAYTYLGVPWMPAYAERGVFVAPGGVRMKEKDLLKFGAIQRAQYMWARGWMLNVKAN